VDHGQDAHATPERGLEGRAASVHVRRGAYLPHWTKDASIYSVTFRLADCLPESVVQGWLAERDDIIRTARQMHRPLAPHEEQRLQYLFSEKVDAYMDAGHGACWMKQDRIAGIVAGALRHFDGRRYRLLAWCVMPNHVHVVVEPLGGRELPEILHSWKSFTANQANKALGRKGEFWQPEYYDHLIRDESDLAHALEYVRRNPERAGLRKWKWSEGGTGFQPVDHGQDAHATSKPPAKVHYARIEGTRDEKLKALDTVASFVCLPWQDCPEAWHAPFRPAGAGAYSVWPMLTDLLPWQQSGVKAGRTWVIAANSDTLEHRWRALCKAEKDKRATLFKNSPTGRKAHDAPYQLPPRGEKLKSIAQVPSNSQPPSTVPYSYRSFDRQVIFADARMLDRPGPSLWAAHGEGQVYVTSLLTKPLGTGPALTACALMPDLDHFSGRGAKDVAPLYRDTQGQEANLLPGLLDVLAKAYGRKWHGLPGHDSGSRAGSPCHLTPEDFLAYVYGVLAQPAFTERFAEELGTRQIRVPITKDADLFAKIRDVGARLLWLHTYGERFVPHGKTRGQVPQGKARCTRPVPAGTAAYPEKYEYDEATKTLHVGDGAFAPVGPEVYEFEVSGLKVVQSWLGYRMKEPKGKRSSPLDDINPERWPSEFTTELLELLWVLEATLAEYPAQAKLLEAVTAGPLFTADELPPVPEAMRKPPKPEVHKELWDQGES